MFSQVISKYPFYHSYEVICFFLSVFNLVTVIKILDIQLVDYTRSGCLFADKMLFFFTVFVALDLSVIESKLLAHYSTLTLPFSL